MRQRRNKYLLVITHRFIKMTKTVPIKGILAAEVALHFVNAWGFNYSPPAELIAANGVCFTSKFFIDVSKIMSMQNTLKTTYHPQSNSQVERYNRKIPTALRTYVAEHPRDWALYSINVVHVPYC